MSEDLPEGWASTSLQRVLEPGGLFDGPFGSNLKTSDYTTSGVRVVRLENLANLRFVGEKETYISTEKYQSLTKHTVVENDIIVGSFVDGDVRVCLMPKLSTPAIAKADCFTVRTMTGAAERRFCTYQLGSAAIRDSLVGDIHGATRPRITTQQLRNCELRLPPLAEQVRIVAQVEPLLEQVNRAKGRLERVPLILKCFRQAVLAAAFRGELGGNQSCSWEQTTLGAVIDGFESGRNLRTEGRPARDGEYGVLKISAVTWGAFQPAENKALLPGDAPRPHEVVRAGDLLISRANTSDLVGAVVTVDQDYPNLMLPDKLLRVLIRRDIAELRYILYALRSEAVREHFSASATGTSDSMRNLSQPKLAAAPIVLPSKAEQKVLSSKIDMLFGVADSIEQRSALAMSRVRTLPQAILSKAFSGELVPTEAELARAEGRTYETAEELLARVAAHAGAEAKPNGKATKRRRRA